MTCEDYFNTHQLMRIILIYNASMTFLPFLITSLALVALAAGWVCRK